MDADPSASEVDWDTLEREVALRAAASGATRSLSSNHHPHPPENEKEVVSNRPETTEEIF